MNYFKIKNFQFSKHNKPYIIAEVSSNHKNKLSAVLKLISKIKKAGADAVKLQTYSEDTMTIDSKREEFKIKKGLWKNYYLWDLYKKGQTPWEWHKELFNYAKKIKIKIFSTPFDEQAVDFLESLNCPFYKVSSFEITDEMSEKIFVIPSKRIRYLSEIAESNRAYDKWALEQKDIAQKLYSINTSLNLLDNSSNETLLNISFCSKHKRCLDLHIKGNR